MLSGYSFIDSRTLEVSQNSLDFNIFAARYSHQGQRANTLTVYLNGTHQ